MKYKQLPFWLFISALIGGLTLPFLFRDGMFMDAILYTAVSKNLAHGIGTFWFPRFSYCGIGGVGTFHEHPPLVFAIQSLFFRIVGDSIYTERFYTALTCFLTCSLMNVLWRTTTTNNVRALGWWPILLWIIIPVCFWSYQNNMQENTMTLFILLSVILFLQSTKSMPIWRQALFTTISAFFIVLAVLCKGIPGFFPLVMPFLFWLTTKQLGFKKMALQTVFYTAIVGISFGVLFLLPESSRSLNTYLIKRVLHRIAMDPTVSSRFYIVGRLLSELIPSLSLSLIIGGLFYWKRNFISSVAYRKTAFFFILLGVCGALPIMLTMVQKGFYFVPALPFFGLGLGLLTAESISKIIDKWDHKTSWLTGVVVSSVLILGVIGYTNLHKGEIWREKETMNDIYAFKNYIPENAIIGAVDTAWDDWTLETGMMRYNGVSLVYNADQFDFFIAAKPLTRPVPPDFFLIPLATRKYDLYERKK